MVRVWMCLTAMTLFGLACSSDSGTEGSRKFNSGAHAPANGGAGSSASNGDFDTPQPAGSDTNKPLMQPSTPAMTMPETNIGPLSIDDCGANNPAALSADDAQKLIAGGGSPGLRILYPYDGTVFPRGLLSPLLMWDGASGPADAVYVHIKSMLFEYKGCLKPTADGQLQLPQNVWDEAGKHTLGGGDPFAIEISTLSAGAVQGPVAEQITIAQATIKGSIYYNSYTSLLPGAPDPGGGMSLIPGAALPAVGGSVLRIPPGGTAERFVSTTCNGCHSLSANGSRLTSQQMLIGGFSYQLAPDTMPNPPQMIAGPRSSFGALYPDGRAFLATSVAIEIARASLTQALDGPVDATLYNTDDGTVIGDTGIPGGALMPMFSPDGTLLVFNDFAAGEAHGIALMDYDTANNKASNYRVLHMESDPMRPGWPFVLPDDKGVVFTVTDGTDFSGEGAGLAGLNVLGPSSDLYMVDVQTGTALIMARAMGFATPDDAKTGTTYLPFGADELHKNYFPTVSPVAAGGYFWVFFDSVRNYGNLGSQRQLWGAAIDIAPDGSYAIDRSHPAYYLPGQEFGTGNHRAFAALDPCKMDGGDCTSGIDCCGGFCSIPESTDSEFGTEPVGTCSSNTPMCSKTNERCTTTADCCPPENGEHANTCIAGFCAYVPGPD